MASSYRRMIWWALLVCAKCLYWFSALMYLGQMFTIISPLEMWIIALSMTLVVDLLQIRLVRRIAGRQAAFERKRLAAVKKAEGAGEPVVDVEELLIRVKRRPGETDLTGGLEAVRGATGSEVGGEFSVASPLEESPLLLTDDHAADESSIGRPSVGYEAGHAQAGGAEVAAEDVTHE